MPTKFGNMRSYLSFTLVDTQSSIRGNARRPNVGPSPWCKKARATERLVSYCSRLYIFGLLILPTLCLAGCAGCSNFPPLNHQPEAQASDPVDEKSETQPTATIPPSPPAAEMSFAREPSEEPAESGANATDGDRDDNPSAGLPTGSAVPAPGQSPGKRRTPTDAEATIKNVGSLREKAKNAAAKKDFGRAFSFSTQAWEAAKAHPNDARLRTIADELATEIESFGNRANSQFSDKSDSTTTRLIEK